MDDVELIANETVCADDAAEPFASVYDSKVMNNNIFFAKVFVNAMRHWKGTFSDDSFLDEVLAHPGHLQGSSWYNSFLEKRKAYIKAQTDEVRFLHASKYLDTTDLEWAVDTILAEMVDVAAPFVNHQNTIVLAEILDLNPTERLILDLCYRLTEGAEYYTAAALNKLTYNERYKDHAVLYSSLLGLPLADVKAAMGGFLFKSGLLMPSSHPGGYHIINDDISEAFTSNRLTLETIEQTLFPSNLRTDLGVENYPHIAKEIGRCEMIINSALKNKTRGMNIMFWGLPGTGKTELALAMAKKNGWNLKVIGDVSDSDSSEKGRTQRLTSLKVAKKLYGRDTNTVLLFDEMEDLFKQDNTASFSKAFINRIIETTEIPIIWTTNALKALGDAVLRRMVYNIAFEVPPTAAREAIWSDYAKRYEVDIDEETIKKLAKTFDTVPALINNSVRIAKMASLATDDIADIISSLDRLMNYGVARQFPKDKPKGKDDTPYNFSWANADVDLAKIADQLLACKPNFSMCLNGAPGTGKTEFVREYARRSGKKVLFKRASDIQSKWLGESEQNIAKAFKEAADKEMILHIDEGDSFLRNRELARNSWEVSTVNEMLSQMEYHSQPFFITTNLMQDIDAAAMRRFTFKVKFDFMRPDQAKEIFQAYFGVEAPKAIENNFVLAPGDFANVRRRAEILGITDAEELYRMLLVECEYKPQHRASIGFKA